MKDSTIKFWLSVPTLIVAFLSIIGNAYVFIVSKAVQDYLIPNSNDYIIMKLIHYLAFIDILWTICESFNFYPTAFGWGEYRTNVCIGIGMANQFLGVFGILWHILIASDFFYLLTMHTKIFRRGSNTTTLSKTKTNTNTHNGSDANSIIYSTNLFLQNPTTYLRIIYCMIFVAIILTIGPYSSYSQFSNYYDTEGVAYGDQCWLIGDSRLTYYIPSMISVSFHFVVLIMAICRYNKTRQFTKAYWY